MSDNQPGASIAPPRLIAIAGPTASGKTAAAIELCRLIGGEVISCDSMMVYRGLNIGTAKPTRAEMRGIPHHMLDVVNPDSPYSVACFRDAARGCIDDILARGKQPVLCGGTGLYIDAVTRNMELAGAPSDEAVRARLMRELEETGAEHMHARLAEVDAATAARLHPNDTRRVARALEIYALTGRPMSDWHERDAENAELYNLYLYALSMPRDILYDRINRRVDIMLAAGLVQEVEGLLASGLSREGTAMQALGYKEIAQALRGEITRAQAVDNLKQRTRNYAKRQMTWLRRDARVRWLHVVPTDAPISIAQRMIEDIKADS